MRIGKQYEEDNDDGAMRCNSVDCYYFLQDALEYSFSTDSAVREPQSSSNLAEDLAQIRSSEQERVCGDGEELLRFFLKIVRLQAFSGLGFSQTETDKVLR